MYRRLESGLNEDWKKVYNHHRAILIKPDELIENTKLDNEIKNLIIYKKALFNSDFVSESENEMFEELINSPEVYILEGYQDDETNSALNQYVKPVRLTTSSFTKKTVANDKLIQYTFEVEKSKTLRTQSV